MDSAAAFKKFLEKNHDVAWMGWTTSLRPQFWEHYHSANAHKPQTNNITNTDDPELDRLIDAYRNSLDEAERKELALAIEAAVHETGCFVPTFMVPLCSDRLLALVAASRSARHQGVRGSL